MDCQPAGIEGTQRRGNEPGSAETGAPGLRGRPARRPRRPARLAAATLSWTLLALLAAGWGSAQAQTGNRPSAPQALAWEQGDGEVTITWRAPARDGGSPIARYEYDLKQGPNNFRTWTVIDRWPGAISYRYTVTGPTNGEQYELTLRARNEAGTVGHYASIDGLKPVSLPRRPSSFSASPGHEQVRLEWGPTYSFGDTPAVAEGYQYWYRINRQRDGALADWVEIPDSAPGGANAAAWTVTGLENGKEYAFRLQAKSNFGGGAWISDTATPRPDAPGPPRWRRDGGLRDPGNGKRGARTGLPRAGRRRGRRHHGLRAPDPRGGRKLRRVDELRRHVRGIHRPRGRKAPVQHSRRGSNDDAAARGAGRRKLRDRAEGAQRDRRRASDQRLGHALQLLVRDRVVPVPPTGGVAGGDNHDWKPWTGTQTREGVPEGYTVQYHGVIRNSRSEGCTFSNPITLITAMSDPAGFAADAAGERSIEVAACQMDGTDQITTVDDSVDEAGDGAITLRLLRVEDTATSSPIAGTPEFRFTVRDNDDREPPAALTARRGHGEVKLEWEPPGDDDASISRYEVRQRAHGESYGPWTSVAGGRQARSHLATGLINGTAYTFEVRARRGNNPAAAARTSETPMAPEWAVSRNRASIREGESVTFSVGTSNRVGFYSDGVDVTLAIIGKVRDTVAARLVTAPGTAAAAGEEPMVTVTIRPGPSTSTESTRAMALTTKRWAPWARPSKSAEQETAPSASTQAEAWTVWV